MPKYFSQQNDTIANDYRPDIDGLRAFAVLSVLFYHAGFSFTDGGFVGVDIFFVISGFLIGKVILEKVEVGKFSFLTFYERRARRLFAPIFVVSIATYILGLIFLMPGDLKLFSQSLFATFLLHSNLHFLSQSGYFDTAAHFKPLLHTWSLSVEEQFYLMFPLFLVIVIKRNILALSLSIVAVVSFIACVVVTKTHPDYAFYVVIFRMWEFIAGTATYLLIKNSTAIFNSKPKWVSEIFALISVMAMCISVFWFDSNDNFPGYKALLPVLGSAALIYVNDKNNTLVRRVFSLGVFSFIGRISFSLYLWHWPLLAYARYYLDRQLTGLEATALLVAGFVLSVATFLLIENPVRFRKARFSSYETLMGGVVLSMFVLILAYHGDSRDGYRWRLSDQSNAHLSVRSDWSPEQFSCVDKSPDQIKRGDICKFGDESNSKKILLWGDSHATAFLPALRSASQQYDVQLSFVGSNGCPPIVNISTKKIYCADTNTSAIEMIKSTKFDIIFVAGNWQAYGTSNVIYNDNEVANVIDLEREFANTLKLLGSMTGRVVIVDQVPGYPIDIPEYLAKISTFSRFDDWSGYQRNLPKPSFSPDWLQNVISKMASQITKVINPRELICGQEKCKIILDDISLYKDRSHISRTGSKIFEPPIMDMLEKLN